jgi:hypothetical protein
MQMEINRTGTTTYSLSSLSRHVDKSQDVSRIGNGNDKGNQSIGSDVGDFGWWLSQQLVTNGQTARHILLSVAELRLE